MKSHRAISINNSLVHGICNYSCRLCGINKASYDGPREFQSFIVTESLIQRIYESAESGINVRYLANSGDGEPTLHPEFNDRISMFGAMLRKWNISAVPPPEVSVVTNGSRLHMPGIMEAFLENDISLIISLPTVVPESYGTIMTGDSIRGHAILSKILPVIEKAMEYRANGQLSKLCFHISPPETKIIRHDFPDTIDFLTCLARSRALEEIELVLFPATSNRSGLIRSNVVRVDMYKDLFRKYNGHTVNGVNIRMKLVVKRFFSNVFEIADLIRSFKFPCLWNANFFIAADGCSICCNDQSARNPLGNILSESLDTLMQYKELYMPGKMCAGCNQSPQRLRGSAEAVLFSIIVRIRMGLSEIRNRYPVSNISTMEQTEYLPPEKEIIEENDNRVEEAEQRGEDTIDTISDSSLPDSIDEMKEAFRLIYDSYLASGYQKKDPSSMRISFSNLLPTSSLITVKKNGEVCGTLTIILESDSRLPINELFNHEINKIRRKDSLICELSGLAVDESLRIDQSRTVLLSLFRKAFILGHDFMGCTDFCMMINPHHCDYYQKEFNFEKIGQIRHYDKVNGAPAVPLRLNLAKGAELFKISNPRLYQYFFISDRQMIKELSYHELSEHRKLYNVKYINSLIRSKEDLLTDLTEKEIRILYGYYPELR
ncbi:MAG: hypothetical protein KAR44_06165 [Candidatus Aegiribacteria sp.]|nr:hypothetical protein [Candidatus Aegiribacteria sp.]